MTRILFTACILSLVIAGAGSAQTPASSPDNSSQYSLAQVKKLARIAHTPEQYKALATYYGKRQKDYLQQAAAEKKEWERRGYNVVSAAAKYPRPADSARNSYEYYMTKASESGALEAKYSRLAAPDGLLNAQ